MLLKMYIFLNTHLSRPCNYLEDTGNRCDSICKCRWPHC